MERFRDQEHLLRLAGLFAAGFALFLVVRWVLIPGDFGVYGHFRAGAVADNAARPLRYAGRQACGDCHGEILEARKGSRHEEVGCEACHGPLRAHAEDPEAAKAQKPDGGKVCLVCHTANVAKPEGFPAVEPKEHAGGEPCGSCHKPHHPEIS